MRTFHFTVMSIDPDENPEDNHQKYGVYVEAESQKDAERKVKGEFQNEYGDLPVYWIKFNGEV